MAEIGRAADPGAYTVLILNGAGWPIADAPILATSPCEPSGTSMDQAIEIVVQFIEARPESRSLAAAATVYEAFSDKWPCQR